MHRLPAITLAVTISALAGCETVEGLIDAARATTPAELIGLGTDLPCDVDRFEAGRLTGAYLQIVEGSMGGTTFAITGRVKPSDAPLPRNLLIDDSLIRRISVDESGTLSGWRQSSATPIAALNTRETLPLAYDLRYRVAGVDFSGPLVAGIPPVQDDIPLLGRVIRRGTVLVTYTSVADDGAVVVSQAAGDFTMDVGFGSGRATFVAGGFTVSDGGPLPFSSLRWNQLRFCGSRIVSSGQGIVRLLDDAGARIPTFGPDAAPDAGTLVLESSQFTTTENPDSPAAIGGVFAIQGDAISLTGVFLSRGPP